MTATDYLFLPVIGLALVALLSLVLRWAHRPPQLDRTDRPVAGTHGLLVPVTTVRDPRTAREMVDVLQAAGIPATTTGPAGQQLLLVWPADAAAARDRLLGRTREHG